MFSMLKKENRHQSRIEECDLIEKMNTLQTKLAVNGKMMDIALPQIVVLGEQSGGKSSVLEGIVGRQFLPRGTGTVTRRPTLIHLYPNQEVYAVFEHKPNEKFSNFEYVKEEIIEETLREPGPKGFSSKPIIIRIYAPNVLKLSLVDLPGIIQTTIDNQEKENVELVKNIVMEYIKQLNTIILAVIPATQDLQNSVALKFAEEVDPKRERTIGVVTKLDLMDEGTNARSILENNQYKLEKGYVGVVNRSQKDIDDDKDIAYALEKEKQFFINHPAYSHMADCMGNVFLQRLLHVELKKHIKKTLPTLKKSIMQQMNEVRKEVKEFETLMGFNGGETNEFQIQAYLLRLLETFKDDYQTKVFGHSEHTKMDVLTAGALINYQLYTKLQELLCMPTGLNDEYLTNLVSNVHGIRNVLSVPSLALEAACGKILKEYLGLLEDFVDSITDILVEAVGESMNSVYLYPLLKTELFQYISEAINKATIETKDLLGKHLKAERAYCNVYRCDFDHKQLQTGLPCSPVKIWSSEQSGISSRSNSSCNGDYFESSSSSTNADFIDVKSLGEKLKENESAKSNTQGLSALIESYLKLIQKQMQDVTIKYIICFLVNGVSNFIKSELAGKLLSSSNIQSLYDECEQDFKQRNEMLKTCQALEEISSYIQSF